MPVCTLHLLSLSTSPDWLLHQVAKEHKVLLASRFRSPPPIIRVGDNSPNADLINETSWSLLLILESEAPSPLSGKAALSSSIREEIIFRTGIPSKLTASLHDRVQQLLSESRERRRNVQLGKNQLPTLIPQVAAPAPLAPDSQNLELSDGLLQFARSLTEAQRDEAFNENASSSAVWMLNLLKFKIGEESKKSYIEYGKVSIYRAAPTPSDQTLTVLLIARGGCSDLLKCLDNLVVQSSW